MVRTAYKLTFNEALVVPFIQRVPITDSDGVSWREAKKQLRKWYLDQAAALRNVTETSYFNE